MSAYAPVHPSDADLPSRIAWCLRSMIKLAELELVIPAVWLTCDQVMAIIKNFTSEDSIRLSALLVCYSKILDMQNFHKVRWEQCKGTAAGRYEQYGTDEDMTQRRKQGHANCHRLLLWLSSAR